MLCSLARVTALTVKSMFMNEQPCNKNTIIEDIRRLYITIKPAVTARIEEFQRTWNEGGDDDIFAELAFCLFTPQSRAQSCWDTVQRLRKQNLLHTGTKRELVREMNRVRFMYTKAENLIAARTLFIVEDALVIKAIIFSLDDPFTAREWLVNNVRGLGYKEASHFLRNTGFGIDLAILDRHIIKNLCLCGAIDNVPASLTKKTYLRFEHCMKQFADEITIPVSHLDLLLWYKQTGEIFK